MEFNRYFYGSESNDPYQISEGLPQYEAYLKEIRDYNPDPNKQLPLKIVRQISKIIKSNLNKLSIVMEEENHSVLFTGDIDAARLKKLTSGKKYEVVKVQHHGTENYINSYIPSGDKYIISCGANPFNWRIGNSIKNYSNVQCTSGNSVSGCFCHHCSCNINCVCNQENIVINT